MEKVGKEAVERPLILVLYHSRSSVAVATSLAMGFSASTCFPALRAFLIYSGCFVIGSLQCPPISSN